jgi:purine-cytosine permease-like protein
MRPIYESNKDHSQKWWDLSSIQLAGGIISIPILKTGAEIALSHGIKDAFFSIVLGNSLLFLISISIVLMGFRTRLNAVQNAEQIIGKKGGRVLAFLILVTMIGWLPRQLLAGSELLKMMLPAFSKIQIGSLIGGLASLLTLFGIKGLKMACVIATIPLMAISLMLLFVINPNALHYELFSIPTKIDLSGTSLIVAVLVASIIDYPTFFRHGKTKKHVVIALILIPIITIVMQVIGLFLTHSYLTDKEMFSEVIFQSPVHAVLLSVFLILSMLTSAAWNIYAASIGWESLFPAYKGRIQYAVIGLTATVLFGAVDIGDIITPMTHLFDTLISGIGGVLVFEFLRGKFSERGISTTDMLCNNFYWGAGAVVGLLTYFNFFLSTSYSTIVSLVAGFIIAFLFTQFRQVYRRVVSR